MARGKFGEVFGWIQRNLLSPELFSMYNVFAIIIGGLLASLLMKPDLPAGPVRSTIYIVFGLGATMLAIKFLAVILKDDNKLASLFVVASFYWWATFALAGYFIEYLILADAYGLWPHWGESTQERVSYFFIGGAAVGLMFKSISFMFVPTDEMIGRKVAAWPFTAVHRWRMRRRQH